MANQTLNYQILRQMYEGDKPIKKLILTLACRCTLQLYSVRWPRTAFALLKWYNRTMHSGHRLGPVFNKNRFCHVHFPIDPNLFIYKVDVPAAATVGIIANFNPNCGWTSSFFPPAWPPPLKTLQIREFGFYSLPGYSHIGCPERDA